MSRKVRLSPDDWLRAGLTALSASGPEALKAEALARDLETTKGSFYWHFPDVPTFRKALLAFWQSNADGSEEPPADRRAAVTQLHHMMRGKGSGVNETEAAVRSWARTDPAAHETLARVDARRLEQLQALLREVGVTNPDIARILHAARIGMSELDDPSGQVNESALDTLVDLVLALR